MILCHRPDSDEMRRYLKAQAEVPINYDGTPISTGITPPGYKLARHACTVGRGEQAFERARAQLMAWRVFGFRCMSLVAGDTPPAPGTNVAFRIDAPGITLLNACRVTEVSDVQDGPDRTYGFTYATLTDHMASGIERFQVSWHHGTDEVVYEIRAYFRAHHILFKLGYPFARWLQHATGHNAVRSMARRIRLEESPS